MASFISCYFMCRSKILSSLMVLYFQVDIFEVQFKYKMIDPLYMYSSCYLANIYLCTTKIKIYNISVTLKRYLVCLPSYFHRYHHQSSLQVITNLLSVILNYSAWSKILNKWIQITYAFHDCLFVLSIMFLRSIQVVCISTAVNFFSA